MSNWKIPSPKALRGRVFFRLATLFFASLVLIVASLVALSMWFFQRSMIEVSDSARAQTLLSLELSVDNKLQEYSNVLYLIVTDPDVRQSLIALDGQGSNQSKSLVVAELTEIFSKYCNSNPDVVSVTVISRDGMMSTYDRTRLQLNGNIWQPRKLSGELDATMIKRADGERRVRFYAEEEPIEDTRLIHAVLAVWDYYSREQMGTVIITMDAKQLWELIGSSAAEQDAFDFLMLEDGRLLAYPEYHRIGGPVEGYRLYPLEEALVPIPAEEANGHPPLFSDRAQVSVKKLNNYNVYLVSVLDFGIYDHWVARYATTLIWMAGLIAVVFLLVYLGVLRGILRSIKTVTAGIQRVRGGDFGVRIQMKARDEIYLIAQAFNSTLESLETIGRERDEEFLRFLRESERRRKAEVRALESQINSHFLYNTLNAINYTAIEGDSMKTSRLIKSLSLCLRYTLDKQWDLVTVRDEMEWLDRYLLLQRERQPSLFRYEIDAAADTLNLPLRKLIIQPFVENAIMHGFSGQGSNHSLKITVRRRENPDRIAVAIYDDGAGIPPQKLEEIRNLLRNYEAADGLGIGIENVCFRLKTHYKSRARLYIRSQAGKGTKINLVIDLAEGE